MTDGTRILRTVGIPLLVAFVLLFALPKTCGRVVQARRERLVTQQPAPPAAAAPSDGGLHIESLNPENLGAPKRLEYPAGLDAQRVQYLIEVDRQFAEPRWMKLPKPGRDVPNLDPKLGPVLVSHGYFQQMPDGYASTREAALKIDGLTEEPDGWRFPVARRKFVAIQEVADHHDGTVGVRFSWQWDPTEVGRELKPSFSQHEGSAVFGGGGEHPWDLNSMQQLDNEWR